MTSSDSTLRDAGLRPTRQRRGMLDVLGGLGACNISADEAHRLSAEKGLRLSLATTYNILNQFAKAGLVRRIDLGERTWFCTCPAGHHHFLDLSTGRLNDIAGRQPLIDHLPEPPPGYELDGVDILIRIRPSESRE